MKKIIFVLVACLALISCGQKEQGITLRFATWDSGDALKIQQDIAEEFMKENPSIKIQVEAYGSGFDQKLVASFGAKNAPDVMYMWDFPTYSSQLENLDSYIKESTEVDLNDYYGGLLNYVKVDNNTYGVPSGFTTHVVFYNKDMFDAAGVKYPSKNWTWDELTEKAAKLSNPNDRVYGIGLLGKPDPYDFEQFLWSNATSYISPDGKTLKGYLNSNESVEVFREMRKLVDNKSGILVGGKQQQSGSDIFKASKIAMYENGIWPLNGYKKAGINVGVAILPSFNGNSPKSVMSVSAISMWKGSENKEEAWKFIEFYNSEKAAKLRVADLPVRKSLVKSFGIEENVELKPFYEMLSLADSTPSFLLNSNWKEVQRNLSPAIEEAMLGLRDPQIIMDEVVEKSERLLKE